MVVDSGVLCVYGVRLDDGDLARVFLDRRQLVKTVPEPCQKHPSAQGKNYCPECGDKVGTREEVQVQHTLKQKFEGLLGYTNYGETLALAIVTPRELRKHLGTGGEPVPGSSLELYELPVAGMLQCNPVVLGTELVRLSTYHDRTDISANSLLEGFHEMVAAELKSLGITKPPTLYSQLYNC